MRIVASLRSMNVGIPRTSFVVGFTLEEGPFEKCIHLTGETRRRQNEGESHRDTINAHSQKRFHHIIGWPISFWACSNNQYTLSDKKRWTKITSLVIDIKCGSHSAPAARPPPPRRNRPKLDANKVESNFYHLPKNSARPPAVSANNESEFFTFCLDTRSSCKRGWGGDGGMRQ